MGNGGIQITGLRHSWQASGVWARSNLRTILGTSASCGNENLEPREERSHSEAGTIVTYWPESREDLLSVLYPPPLSF